MNGGMSAIGTKRTMQLRRICPLLGQSGHGYFAAQICPLMTQSGHRFGVGRFSLHYFITDNRSHGTSAVPEGYLVSHLANELRKKGLALVIML